jgi:hypothetical protein
MARSTEYDDLLGAEAAVGPLPEADDVVDPYGPLEADEASWFTVAGDAGEGDERAMQAAIARLFAG